MLRGRVAPLLSVGVAVVTALAACAPVGEATDVPPLGAGFLGDVASPAPESTIAPQAGSWDGVVPGSGYRVVLIAADDDPATSTLVSAVEAYAVRHDTHLTTLTAVDDDGVADRLDEAVGVQPDLVIGVGPAVVDVFALLTAQHLHQDFLVLGAELAEPTENVTSVVWPGATFRGTGLGTAGAVDPASVTAARSSDAVAAGIASVLHGVTGVVLDLG